MRKDSAWSQVIAEHWISNRMVSAFSLGCIRSHSRVINFVIARFSACDLPSVNSWHGFCENELRLHEPQRNARRTQWRVGAESSYDSKQFK
jgi:hypothetical protein